MVKRVNSTANWAIYDKERGDYTKLSANLTSEELAGGSSIKFDNPNGFSIDGAQSDSNATGSEYIYVAIKEGAQAGQFPPNRKAFSTTLYEGTEQVNPITTGIDNTSKSLVWIKSKSTFQTLFTLHRT